MRNRFKTKAQSNSSNSSDHLHDSDPVNVSLRLAPGLAKSLDKYCSATGVSRNGVISLSISDFLSSRGCMR